MTAITAWLDAAQARADAATPGPWKPRDSVDGFAASVQGPRGCVAAARSTPSRELGAELGPLQQGRRHEDADFIAAARMDLPAAIAALRAVLDLHHPVAGGYCAGCFEGGGCDGASSWPCPTVTAVASALGVSEP